MGWKTINNRPYYYRSQRQGDGVISQYLGRGEAARRIAQLETGEREKKKAKHQAEAKAIQQMTVEDAVINQVLDAVESVMAVLLSRNGFHNHHGQWRKKRRSND